MEWRQACKISDIIETRCFKLDGIKGIHDCLFLLTGCQVKMVNLLVKVVFIFLETKKQTKKLTLPSHHIKKNKLWVCQYVMQYGQWI